MASTRSRIRPGAAVLAGLCGLALTVGALLPWDAGRGPRPGSGMTHTSISGLFHWDYQNSSPFWRSFAVVVLVAGVLVLVGAMVGSRIVTSLFCLAALAAGGLWIALTAYHYDKVYGAIDWPSADLRIGAWLTLVGGLVGLCTTFALRRRR